MESKIIKVNGSEYTYQLKRKSRAKYLRLTIQRDGSLTITAPRTYPLFLIKKFIISRWNWVLKNKEKKGKTPSIFDIKHSETQIKEYKKMTRLLVEDRLNHFNQIYQFKFNRIAIRNQSTRWGSCSSAKNLNFNYRLCLLPQDLADYIIVHELCHLSEMNHSPRFWNLVRETIYNFKEYERKLKKI